MAQGKVSHLSDRSLIRIAGVDASDLLHRIITCEVSALPQGKSAFGALLTPQGKILFDFFLIRDTDGFIADIAHEHAEAFIKRLNFYRLRAKVDIAPLEEDIQVFACWNEAPDAVDGLLTTDPRLGEMGWRVYGKMTPNADVDSYHAHRIALGMPAGGFDFSYGDAFPHEVLMDQFRGVDFVKGCYVGQEVVSRMEHRGTARKRIVMVSSGKALPPSGTQIRAGNKPAGTLGSTSGAAGLALARLDRIAAAKNGGETIVADEVPLEVKLPPYVNFGWPQAA
jgi:tRNA-modifying protein YgfZ